MSDKDTNDGRKTVAYILLGVATYLILSNIGLFDFIGISSIISWLFRTFFNLLPAAILGLGLYWMITSQAEGRPVISWVAILIGAVLLISQFGLFGLSFGNLFLPMWLVIVAFVVMNPRDILPRRFNMQAEDLSEDSETLKLVAFMGGSELNYTTQDLKGGEVFAFWGGYTLDFTEAEMHGDTMELNLFCIMGGVEVIVPPHWEVEKRGAVCIMGGFSNKTHCLAEQLDMPRKTLIVKGLALMGGGEIKN
jgi:predicted membrane protein